MGFVKYTTIPGDGSATPVTDAENYLSKGNSKSNYGPSEKQYGDSFQNDEEDMIQNPIDAMKDLYISPGKQIIPDYTSFLKQDKRVA